MLAVYPWAFLIYGIGTPETLEQIRVKRSPLFLFVSIENCRLWAAAKKNI